MEQPPGGSDNISKLAWVGNSQLSHEFDDARRMDLISEALDMAGPKGTIEDWIASHIATELSLGPDSALDEFSRTGEIAAAVHDELKQVYDEQHGRRRLIDALETYIAAREIHGPVVHWAEMVARRNSFDSVWRAMQSETVRAVEASRCDVQAAHLQPGQRTVDDQTAYRMFALLAPGPHSAIAGFVATGIVTEALSREVRLIYMHSDRQAQNWIAHVGMWAAHRAGVSLIRGWWPTAATPPGAQSPFGSPDLHM